MITYLAKESFTQATYARAVRQRAFTRYLAREVPGSVSFFTEVGGSSASAEGTAAALWRLFASLRAVWRARNPWVVVDYPNFPASVPRRLSVSLAATTYLVALRGVCVLAHMKLVVQSDDDPVMQDQWLGLPLSRRQVARERRFERRLYRSADSIWFSARTAAELICELFDVPISRSVNVPNGADAPVEGRTGSPDGLFRFAYTGALLPNTHSVKGLIDAFRSVPSAHARLVLAGPDGGWISDHLAQRADSRVVYLGCLTAEESQSVLAMCDAGVLTGQRGGYHDTGFPGKLGSYFAAGLPVVTTCGGDARRIIEARHVGVVCDEQTLGRALEQMVQDSASFAEMTANAMAARRDYTWDRIYQRAVASLGVDLQSPQSEGLVEAHRAEALLSEWEGGEST